MSILASRFSKLEKLPKVDLTVTPTPIVRARQISETTGIEVLIKREDLVANPYGGNKIRKLEYLLGDAKAKGAQTIVTTGALGSHHVLATALYGTRMGFTVHALLVPQPITDHVREICEMQAQAGAVQHLASSYTRLVMQGASLVSRLQLGGQKPYFIGPGGSNAVGTIGQVELGLELAQQFVTQPGTEPEAIFVALGSGGTAAGIALGLAVAGIQKPVVAVRVSPRSILREGYVRSLLDRTFHSLRKRDDRFPNVIATAQKNLEFEDRELGKGYGHATEGGLIAVDLAKQDNLHLEETYTGKAMAALMRQVSDGRFKQRVLFVNTLGVLHGGLGIAKAPLSEPVKQALSQFPAPHDRVILD